MQQTCAQCGVVAQTASKFCRQCGAPMTTDAPAQEAATRQYGRQSPAPEGAPTSHPFTTPVPPPTNSVADAFAPDTARFHNQPPPPAAQPGFNQAYGQNYGQPGVPAPLPPAYPAPAAPKSNWWKWALGFVLVTVLACGGMVAYTVQRAAEVSSGVKKTIDDAVAQAKKDAEEAARRGSVPEGVPAPPPPPPPAPGETVSNLEQLQYPNAKVTSRVRAMGQHVITLETTDSFEQVKTYYQKYLGEPLVETDETDTREVVFQKAPLMVTIDYTKTGSGKLSITLINSSFIPSVNNK